MSALGQFILVILLSFVTIKARPRNEFMYGDEEYYPENVDEPNSELYHEIIEVLNKHLGPTFEELENIGPEAREGNETDILKYSYFLRIKQSVAKDLRRKVSQPL